MNTRSYIEVAIHQPNFLPWMGYFYKISQSDIFIFLDDVTFSKGSFTSRVKIHDHKGEDKWMSAALDKPSIHSPINQIKTVSNDWPEKILNQIHMSYQKAPYFDTAFVILEKWRSTFNPGDKLSDINEKLIRLITLHLGMERKFVKSSSLVANGDTTENLLGLVRQVGGTTYLRGMGSLKYMDDSYFIHEGLEIKDMNFPSLVRQKVPDSFINKSIVCYLCHYSIEEIRSFLGL